MQSMIESIKRLTSKKSKVSCHYFIDQSGNLFKFVQENKIAWHAGKSKWKTFKNLNKFSIGIELENKGHNFKYENFKTMQLKSLIKLLKYLVKQYKIKFYNILGHSDIAPLRKKDPGEKFPWDKVLGKVFPKGGFKIDYAKVSKKKIHSKILKKVFLNNLKQIGYRYLNSKKDNNRVKKVISAFQRRYRQKKINGILDYECLKISEKILISLKKA